MTHLTRIIDWLTTWYTPVSGELVDALEKASKDAATKTGEATPYPYELLIGRKNVFIRPRDPRTLSHWGNRLMYIWQGRPIKVTLYQGQATGFIGPFAKLRKSRRASGPVKENALIFWPAPKGKIAPLATKAVLKIGVADATLAREIRMLRMVGQGAGLIPSMIGYDPKLKWHSIKFIGNAKREDELGQAKLYLDHIAERYFDYWKTKTISCKRHIQKRGIGEVEFLETATAMKIQSPDKLLNGLLTTSITHGGGICEECLLTDDEKAYFLDWEKARLAPIGDDILQAFQYQPQRALELFTKYVSQNSLSAHEQLSVSLICRNIANTKKRLPIQQKLKLDHSAAGLLRELLP